MRAHLLSASPGTVAGKSFSAQTFARLLHDGDLLPNATQANRIATGFLRNGMVNEEGAIIAEQFRMELVKKFPDAFIVEYGRL